MDIEERGVRLRLTIVDTPGITTSLLVNISYLIERCIDITLV